MEFHCFVTNTLYLVIIVSCIRFLVAGELFTSVDHMSSLTELQQKFSLALSDQIQVEKDRLNRLYQLQKTVINVLSLEDEQYNGSFEFKLSLANRTMTHPIRAFVAINNAVQIVDELYSLIDSDNVETRFSELETLLENYTLPTPDDLSGSAEAILRLQTVYNLDMNDLAQGRLVVNSAANLDQSDLPEYITRGPPMSSQDCFTLGRVAFELEDYEISIKWLEKALIMSREATYNIDRATNKFKYSMSIAKENDLLEYLAFAAFKNGQLKYATQLTKLWLEKDPDNERALGNLDYYIEELEQDYKSTYAKVHLLGNQAEIISDDSIQESITEAVLKKQRHDKAMEGDLTNNIDGVVMSICRNEFTKTIIATCSRNWVTLEDDTNFELKLETLYENPTVIRVYDIITEYEAYHIRQQALPELSRAEVSLGLTKRITKSRIAKSAWLKKEKDDIIRNVTSRVSSVLNINLNDSEPLQVVNYGLGGFYGAHLDALGYSNLTEVYRDNDRLATILIYLNKVEAGGSTAFPRLGLNVRPVERSAIMWYNTIDGYRDGRTIHAGCPVLLGSKWIATLWPREGANGLAGSCPMNLKHWQ